jgi:predicted porin
MQKKLIALAVAGLVAAPAFAQSNVTIYGRVDYGFLSRGGDNGALGDIDTKTEFASGIQAGSRLGFKGAEDLGNGLKAIFELEFGSIANDKNSGLQGSRHQYVGLTGPFGTVVGGRLDGVRYGIFGKYDAFANGNVGNFTQMTAQVDRANNAVAYISPAFSGFTFVGAYSSHIGDSNPLGLVPDESAGNEGDARLNTLMLSYDNGPINANVDWERVYFQGSDLEVRVFTVAGAYDFGMVKLSALYDILKVDDAGGSEVSDVRSWFVSAKAPITDAVVLKATYGQTKDKEVDDSKAKKFGIGADYMLSKRTNFYASYGSIRNDDNSAIQLGYAGSHYGSSSAYGVRGFDLGIAHKF